MLRPDLERAADLVADALHDISCALDRLVQAEDESALAEITLRAGVLAEALVAGERDQEQDDRAA